MKLIKTEKEDEYLVEIYQERELEKRKEKMIEAYSIIQSLFRDDLKFYYTVEEVRELKRQGKGNF